MDGRQSTFVTVLAWLVIVFAGMSTLAGLLQSALVGMMMTPLSESEAQTMPPLMRVVFANFDWLIYANTTLSAAALATGIGLLKRKEWARLVTIAMLIFSIVGTIALVIAQQFFIAAIFPEGPDMPADVQSVMLAMRVGTAIFGLLFIVLHGWLTFRLLSPAVRAEFVR
jgi:hypothetical protein